VEHVEPAKMVRSGLVGLQARPKMVGGGSVFGSPVMPGVIRGGHPAAAVPPPPAAALVTLSGAALKAQAQHRVITLEAAIQANPHDLAAWEARIREALLAGTTEEASPEDVFERVVKQWPYAPRIWSMYAEWAEGEGTALGSAVYRRCLQQVPNLELWLSYLGFCKRLLPLEDVLRAYAQAVDLLGTDSRGGLLWAEYLALLKHTYNVQQKKDNPDAETSGKLLAEDTNPMEAARRNAKPAIRQRIEGTKAADVSDDEFLRVGAVLKIGNEFMRRTFQRAASTAHSALDKLWVGYEQFEKSQGNPPLAQKLLAEHMPRFVRGKAAFKELQGLCNGMDYAALAVPITPKTAVQQTKLFEKWRGVLQFEQTNPLRLDRKDLQARVTLLFQQAALGCAYHAELWHDFAEWLDLGGQREEATACLRRAVERFLPSDLTLRLMAAQRHELAEVPLSAANMEAAEEEYQKLLEEMPKPCPLALINYLAFVRRQRGGGDFRSAFVEAIESSPHCTWEVYTFAAQTEYHIFGSSDAACKVFRLGLERYGEREPSLLAAYVNFLISTNDLRSARAELSRGVLDRLQAAVRDKMSKRSDPRLEESLAFLWQKWSRLERYFGDAASVRRCAAFRDEEFRSLQKDQEVEEDAIVETPAAFGLAMTISEVEEGFRFQHLKPEGVRRRPEGVGAGAEASASSSPASPKAAGPVVHPAKAAAPAPNGAAAGAAEEAAGPLVDHAVSEATEEHRRLAGGSSNIIGMSVHIARPDVSKMLAFRPALDVLGLKKETAVGSRAGVPAGAAAAGTPAAPSDPRARPTAAAGGIALNAEEEQVPLPTMIPKCLQDLMAVLPSRPLKGAKPDVDYLLTVLQTVSIPPIPVKELERFRYDSLRLKKEEDNATLRRRGLVKDEFEADGSGFFSSRPTIYRERLQAKRQRFSEELGTAKSE